MSLKLISCLILTSLLVGSFSNVAQATEIAPYPPYVYLAENPTKQIPESPYKYNHVDAWWWTGQALPWFSYSAIQADVTTVINNWRNAIGYLNYQPLLSEQGAKLEFFYWQDPCPYRPNAVGCHVVIDTLYVQDRDAEYLYTAFININSRLLPTSNSYRVAAIAHELGHHYGLDERYIEILGGFDVACNPYERTVMNASTPPDPNCPPNEAPTALDRQRINAFWSGGDPRGETRGDLPILANGEGPVATYRWQDMAWAEFKHRLRFYYWSGTEWVQYRKADGTLYELETWLYSGAHLYTEPRTISIMDYPSVPSGKPNRACSWAWFQAYGQYYGDESGYGNDRCSDGVTLTQPPP